MATHSGNLAWKIPWTEEPERLQLACQWRRPKRRGFNPQAGKIPWKRTWQSTPVFLPGEFHGQRSLVGYSSWGHKDLDMIEATQYTSRQSHLNRSCSMRNWRRQWHPTPVLLPGKSMDRGAWQAAVHGVARSRTRLSDFTFTFLFHALEKEMATHSSVLAWRIPGTVELGGLPSMGSHIVGHD